MGPRALGPTYIGYQVPGMTWMYVLYISIKKWQKEVIPALPVHQRAAHGKLRTFLSQVTG